MAVEIGYPGPRAHKTYKSSLLISVSLFCYIFFLKNWDWDQKWPCLSFMSPGPDFHTVACQLVIKITNKSLHLRWGKYPTPNLFFQNLLSNKQNKDIKQIITKEIRALNYPKNVYMEKKVHPHQYFFWLMKNTTSCTFCPKKITIICNYVYW